MTAVVNFTFSEVTSGNATSTAPLAWQNTELALSEKATGAATCVESAQAGAAFTPGLSFSGFVLPQSISKSVIEGVQIDLWISSNNPISGNPSLIVPVNFRGAPIGDSASRGSLDTWGASPNASNKAPINPISYGGATDLWGYSAGLSVDQFTENLLYISGLVTAPASARTLSIWSVSGRIWLDAVSMQDVVQRAFRKVAILSKDTTIEGDDLSHGLDLLNDMLFAWETYGVNIGHGQLAASDVFPIARKYVEGTAMQLAERLSPDYQVPAMSSQRFFAALQRDYNNVPQADWRDLNEDGVVSDDEADAADRSEFY